MVSELALGCGSLAGINTPVSDEQARATLETALTLGVRYFDTAPFYGYGRSERLVGDALRAQHRNNVTLSTKVGRLLKPARHEGASIEPWIDPLPMKPSYDYSYDGIMRSFEDSLQRLGLSRIDILYLHDVDVSTHGTKAQVAVMDEAMSGGYRAMSELRDNGLVSAIGLGVNDADVCVEAMNRGQWDCMLLAGRYTLLEQSALDHFFPACERTNTSVVIGGPFNSGILVGGGTYNYQSAPTNIINKVREIERVCDRYDVPLPAAALQFTLAHPMVSSVIPGPRSPNELREIIAWYECCIPTQFWLDLKSRELLCANAPTPKSD